MAIREGLCTISPDFAGLIVQVVTYCADYKWRGFVATNMPTIPGKCEVSDKPWAPSWKTAMPAEANISAIL